MTVEGVVGSEEVTSPLVSTVPVLPRTSGPVAQYSFRSFVPSASPRPSSRSPFEVKTDPS